MMFTPKFLARPTRRAIPLNWEVEAAATEANSRLGWPRRRRFRPKEGRVSIPSKLR
jgi:hypothetical protein